MSGGSIAKWWHDGSHPIWKLAMVGAFFLGTYISGSAGADDFGLKDMGGSVGSGAVGVVVGRFLFGGK